MRETSKCHRLRCERGDFDRYLRGVGIDVGAGDDCLRVPDGSVRPFDKAQGDAQRLDGVPDGAFDFAYSSHCLEHLRDVHEALRNWLRVLRPGGFLYVVVPDYLHYEKLQFPSAFNHDHRQTFSLDITRGQTRRANHWHVRLDLYPTLVTLGGEPIDAWLETDGFDYNRGREDQTLGPALSQIAIVAARRRYEDQYVSAPPS